MNKYERTVEALDLGKDHTMKVFGQSMTPIIESGSALTFRKTDDYQVGDVVISKVKGRFIDAHKITKIDSEGRYLISNNKGWDNGWTRKVFGRVIAVNGEPFGRKTG
jgi:SOS-response transcriptional repressor LexA